MSNTTHFFGKKRGTKRRFFRLRGALFEPPFTYFVRLNRLEGVERNASFPFVTGTRLRRLHPVASGSASVSPGATAIASASSAESSRTRHRSEPTIPGVRRQGSGIFHSAQRFLLRIFRKPKPPQRPPPTVRLHASFSEQNLHGSVEADAQSTEVTAAAAAGLTLTEAGFESTSGSTASSSPSVSPFYTPSEWNRPPLPGPLWRMSPVDASSGLFFESSGGLVN